MTRHSLLLARSGRVTSTPARREPAGAVPSHRGVFVAPSACRWCGRVARVPIWAQPSVRARFLTLYACVSHFGFALVSYARDAPCSPQTLLGLWQRSLSRPHASPCNTKTWSLGLWPHGGDLGHRPTIRELLRFPVLQIYIEHSPAGGVTDETGQ